MNGVREIFESLSHGHLVDTFWGKLLIKAWDDARVSRDMMLRATDWNTCACGKGIPEHLKNSSGRPNDPILHRFGENFGYDLLDARQQVEDIEEPKGNKKIPENAEYIRGLIESAARAQVSIEKRMAYLLKNNL